MLRPVVLHILLLVFFTDQAAAQYDPVISSSWSMWSPWSFCSNNLMIRVRACSTVRGYKCAGHNKEFQSCSSAPPKRNQLDYDHQDPEAVDREMAMRQLYQDYEPGVPDNVEFVPKVPLMTRGGRPFMETRPAVPTTTTRPEPIEQIAQRFANSETSNLSVIPPQRNDDNFAVINMKEPSSTSSSTTTSEPIKTTTASEGEEVPASAEPGKEEEEEKLSLEERRGLEDVKSALEERLAEKERLLEEERRRQEEEERILEERRRQEEQKLQEERQALEAQKRQEEQRLAVERRLQKEKKLQEDQRRLQEEQGRLQEEQKVREEQRRLQEELKLQEEQRRLQAGLKLQEEQRRLQAGLKLQEEQRRLQQEEQLQEEQLRKLQEQERLQEEEKLQKERLQDKKRVQQEEQLQKELQLQEDGRRQEERRLSEERRLQVEHQLREDQRHQEDQRRIQEEVALKSRLEEAGRRVASQNSDFSLSDHEFSEKFGQSREPELSFGKPVVHLEDSEATSDSFPIEAEPESDFSGSTHSVGSYAIGKEPSVELPKFSIAHRAELPEVRRAPTQPSTSVAHVELPMSMIPEVVAPAPVHLVTANQKLRSMPRFMGEMKAYPRKVVPTTTTVPTPSPATSVKPNQLTVEITSAPTKKKLRKTKTRRLKKLNRRGRMKVVAVVPTDATMVTEAPNEQKMSQNSNNIGRRVAGEASVTTEVIIFKFGSE
ncbi:unnamed protein product [Caenorhabditis auriculariae]|uniref:Uncharacterized protein n=1 Tax=Caenorhabditis auriculariae TaxID=2777116 RepID=A0A8S1HGE4_9PELO|nr:unnamed protein product [Caenorhabditis auriculariae]